MLRERRNVFLFENLAFDLQHYIITYFIPTRDLYSLASVSKNINSLAIPALYRHVRLLPGLPFKLASSQLSGAFTKCLALAQEAFSKKLLSPSSPEEAAMIRSLEWHMSSYGISPQQAFFEVFPKLRNLRKLHLMNAHPTNMTELNLVIPPLFPHLHEVEISGITHLPFIKPMLHSPHRIHAITLTAPAPHPVHLQLLQWLSEKNFRGLEKLTLLTSCASDEWKIGEIIEGWLGLLYAVRKSVKEVALGFHLLRGGTCTKEEQRAFSLKLYHGLLSVSGQVELTHLQKISLIGVEKPRSPLKFNWRSRWEVHIEFIDSLFDVPSLLPVIKDPYGCR